MTEEQKLWYASGMKYAMEALRANLKSLIAFSVDVERRSPGSGSVTKDQVDRIYHEFAKHYSGTLLGK